MRLSFDDEESFKEAAGTLRFNISPPSDTSTLQQIGSSSSSSWQWLPQDSERNEDNLTTDPNTFRRLGMGSSSSSSSSSSMISPQEGSENK